MVDEEIWMLCLFLPRPKTDARQGPKLLQRIGAGIALAAVSLLGFAVPAQADPLTGIIDPDSITLDVTDGETPPLHVWSWVELTAAFTVPAGAQQGDTFGMTLPAVFGPTTGLTFNLPTTSDPNVNIATCEIQDIGENTVGERELVCTLTDYFSEDRGDVNGTLQMYLKALEETTDNSVAFTVDGQTKLIDLPGSGPIGPFLDPAIDNEVRKNASQTAENDVLWRVDFKGSSVAGTNPVVVTDELIPAGQHTGENGPETYENHQYVAGSLKYYERPTGAGAFAHVTDSQFNGDFDADLAGFTLTSEGELDPAKDYRIEYRTKTIGPWFDSDVLGNTVDVSGKSVTKSVGLSYAGSGQGEGGLLGRFSIVKNVDASCVPNPNPNEEDSEYTIEYYLGTDEATTYTMTLHANEAPQRSIRAAAGTPFTITEVSLPTRSGGETWSPAFSVNGVAQAPDDTVTVTPGQGEIFELILTSTVLCPAPDPGSFTVLNALGGDAAELATAPTYTVDYSFATTTGSLDLTAGTPSEAVEAPVGTVVTLTEVNLPNAAELGLQDWVVSFDGPGVTTTGKHSATFTVTEAANVEIELTNTAPKVEVPPVEPEEPEEPEVPQTKPPVKETPTPNTKPAPPTPALATTGAESLVLPLGVGLLLVTGGVVLWSRRARRS